MKKLLFLLTITALVVPNFTLATTSSSCDTESTLPVPEVTAVAQDSGVLVSWEQIDDSRFSGYKVVVAQHNSAPKYSADGYLSYITNPSTTSYLVNNSKAYNGGDFGGYLQDGQDYYFSVTAVYGGCSYAKIAGNAVQVTYNGDSEEEDLTDLLNIVKTNIYSVTEDSAKVYWKAGAGSSGEYRLATSTSALSSKAWTDYGVSNDPDVTGNMFASLLTLTNLDEDTKYYIQLRKYWMSGETPEYGNTVKLNFTTLGESTDDLPVPVVSLNNYPGPNGGPIIKWEPIDHSSFSGYKIVASKNNPNPVYPNDGYLKYITTATTMGLIVENTTPYHNGDFGSYFTPGEDYYFSVTALYGSQKVAGNAIQVTYNGPAYDDKEEEEEDDDHYKDDPIIIMNEKAKLLHNNELGDILAELKELRSIVKEQANEIKYLKSLVSDLSAVTQAVKDSINQFITYGVDDNTKKLGEGERAAVIHSFKAAFDKLPETEDELADAIKIANGRWPTNTSLNAETRAENEFRRIYLRNPNMNNPNDNAAVTIMAYGLRQRAENRNLNSEIQGIETFKYIYGKLPNTTEEWNTMQAITYSGATR